MRVHHLIVGGGVAGVSAAETIRAERPADSIALVSAEAHPLYSRVLLPHYVRGDIERERLFLRKAGELEGRGITVCAGARAARLDCSARSLWLADGREIEFTNLLLATGGTPRALGIPGQDLSGVSRFQTIEDADVMRESLRRATTAVVVGGGFIALEYAEILARRSVPGTVLVDGPHFFYRQLDADGGALIASALEHRHLSVRTQSKIARIEGSGAVQNVLTQSGERIPADFVGVGIGLVRDVGWLPSEIRGSGGIGVDRQLRTFAEGLFAAGDAAEVTSPVFRRRRAGGNWVNAASQGRIAGWNMARPEAMRPFETVSSYAIRVLGLSISFIGRCEIGAGIETASHRGEATRTYARVFVENGRLAGVALINRPADQARLTSFVQSGAPVGRAEDALAALALDRAAPAAGTSSEQ